MAGESATTRKRLMADAGFRPSDFQEDTTPQKIASAAADRIGAPRKTYNPREMTQAEHDAQRRADNAKADEAYQKWVAGGKK